MTSLKTSDPEIFALCLEEKDRQRKGIELIASENFPNSSVLETLSSSFHNKYSEGYPNSRYYGGTEVIDKLELLCQERALKVFDLDPALWGVNVQALSGSPANFAVFTALAGPHGRIMGLDLPDGGHLTHGFQTPTGKKVSATLLFFESMPYKLHNETHLIDYEALAKNSKLFQPKIIIAGTSVYSRHLDYAKFRDICDSIGAILMADMAHISGLVAAKEHPSPFDYCDVVTTTTHKTLRGPRSALIFYRKIKFGHFPSDPVNKPLLNGSTDSSKIKSNDTNFGRLINEAIFPGLSGGPHNHSIAAVAVALGQAMKPEFRQYQRQVIANMQTLSSLLLEAGLRVITGGTDVHLCLVNLKPFGLDGSKGESVLDKIGIIVNKNTVPGDASALRPSGIRIGTPAVTSRDMKQEDMVRIAKFIIQGLNLAKCAVRKMAGKTHEEFLSVLNEDAEISPQIKMLKENVEQFARPFPLPGLDY